MVSINPDADKCEQIRQKSFIPAAYIGNVLVAYTEYICIIFNEMTKYKLHKMHYYYICYTNI